MQDRVNRARGEWARVRGRRNLRHQGRFMRVAARTRLSSPRRRRRPVATGSGWRTAAPHPVHREGRPEANATPVLWTPI